MRPQNPKANSLSEIKPKTLTIH
jgi:hypothetical protein